MTSSTVRSSAACSSSIDEAGSVQAGGADYRPTSLLARFAHRPASGTDDHRATSVEADGACQGGRSRLRFAVAMCSPSPTERLHAMIVPDRSGPER